MNRKERFNAALLELLRFKRMAYRSTLFGEPIDEDSRRFYMGKPVEDCIRSEASLLVEEYGKWEPYTGGYDPYLDCDIDPDELYKESRKYKVEEII